MHDVETVAGNRWNKDWWLLLVLGVIAVVIGCMAMIWPFLSGVAYTKVFGVILIIAATVQLIHTVRLRKGVWSIILGLLVALLYAATGLLLLAYPLRGMFIVAVILGVTFTVQGIFQLAESLDRAGLAGWVWLFVGAILTLILGIWILATLPISVAWALGFVVGVNLIFLGVSLISESSSLHRQARLIPATQL